MFAAAALSTPCSAARTVALPNPAVARRPALAAAPPSSRSTFFGTSARGFTAARAGLRSASFRFCGPVASAAVEQLQKVLEEQKKLPSLSAAEVVRGLVKRARYCTISTNSSINPGYPQGAVAQMAEIDGTPFFSFSTLAIHTKDLLADPRCSITITAPNFSGLTDPRVVIVGKCEKVADSEAAALKEVYMKTHPEAFWVDFGDFSFYKFTSIIAVNYVGGFGSQANFGSDEYYAVSPDPLIDFAAPVMRHMNDDHEEDLKLYAKHFLNLEIDGAKMSGVDQYGFDMAISVGETKATVRLPFPQPVTNRKAIKEALVALHQEAVGAQGEGSK